MHADEVLSESEKKILFGNIEEILSANQLFLSAISDCTDAISIGDIICEFMSNHFVPYAEYCCNHKRACEFLRQRERQDDRFRKFMSDGLIAGNSQGLDLSSFLLEPVQRIARYPLLLKNIINYSNTEPMKKSFTRSLQAAQQLLDTVNAAVGQHENEERLRELDYLLQWRDFKVNLTEPCKWGQQRELLVTDIEAIDLMNRPVKAFLFTDFVLLTDGLVANKVQGGLWPIEQVEFDGQSLSFGMERIFLPCDEEGIMAVRVRAALDNAQQAFYAALDRDDTTKTRNDTEYCGILTVSIIHLGNLYQLPSKFARPPRPLIKLSMLNTNMTSYSTLQSTPDPQLPITEQLMVQTPADHLLLQVLDDRPFAPPVPMGRYRMAVGDLADYFAGTTTKHCVQLEGVPRGDVEFSVCYTAI